MVSARDYVPVGSLYLRVYKHGVLLSSERIPAVGGRLSLVDVSPEPFRLNLLVCEVVVFDDAEWYVHDYAAVLTVTVCLLYAAISWVLRRADKKRHGFPVVAVRRNQAEGPVER